MALLDNLKQRLTENNLGDELLKACLEDAGSAILDRLYKVVDRPDNAQVPSKYEGLQVRIAVILANKVGAEGQVAHSENGVVRTYSSADIPTSMLNEVVPFARLF